MKLLKKKEQTMKISEYYQITKPNYVYLKLVTSSSIRNYNSDQLAALSNQIYKKMLDRIHVEEKKFFYEQRSSIKYYIHITKKEVSFYYIVPAYYKKLATEKINSVWSSKVTVKEVSKEEVPMLATDCTKYELKYKYEDMLSLKTDSRTNELLSNNLSIIEILEEEDQVAILYNMIPQSPSYAKQWRAYCEDTYEKYKNNAPLDKNKMSARYTAKIFAMVLVNVIDGVISGMQDALGVKADKDSKAPVNSYLSQGRKELSNGTKKKQGSDIVQVQTVIMSQSTSKAKEEINAKALCNSFKSISDDNELVAKKVKKKINIEDRVLPVTVNKMSTKEVANMVALPGDELLKELKNIEHTNILEKPLDEELRGGEVVLGDAKCKNVTEEATLPSDKNLGMLPIVMASGMGAGKTNELVNLADDMINKEKSNVIVFDYIDNCELSEAIKTITPKENIIEIDLSNNDCLEAFAYNEIQILEDMDVFEKVERATMQSNSVLHLIDALNAELPLTSAMNRYLFSAATIVFTQNEKSLKDVLKVLQNYDYRHELINSLSDELQDFLSDEIDALKELDDIDKKGNTGTKDSKIDGILQRVGVLQRNLRLKYMLNKSPKNNLNFAELLQQKNKVILIRLPEHTFNNKAIKDVIVSFYLTKIWNALLINGKLNKARNKVNIIIDESHQVRVAANNILPPMLVESRKFGCRFIFANHYLKQLGNMLEPLLSSAHFMLLQGADTKNFDMLADRFGEYTKDDMANMVKYQAICTIRTKKGYGSCIVSMKENKKYKAVIEKKKQEEYEFYEPLVA